MKKILTGIILLAAASLACNLTILEIFGDADSYYEAFEECMSREFNALDVSEIPLDELESFLDSQTPAIEDKCLGEVVPPELHDDIHTYRDCLRDQSCDDKVFSDFLTATAGPAPLEQTEQAIETQKAQATQEAELTAQASGDELDSPTGTLTLLSHEAHVKSCTSTTDGDYYVLDCIFTITANLSYEISSTPAYAICRASTLTNGDVNSLELVDLQNEITLSVDVPGVMRQFENGEGPVENVDGYYVNLSCTLSQFEGVETGGLDSFHCKHPDVAEKDCDGPWMDFSGWSP